MTTQTIGRSVAVSVAAEQQVLLDRFAKHLTGRGYASRTRQMYVDAVAHFLRWRAGHHATATHRAGSRLIPWLLPGAVRTCDAQ